MTLLPKCYVRNAIFKTMNKSESQSMVTVITKLLHEYLSGYYYLKLLQVVAVKIIAFCHLASFQL